MEWIVNATYLGPRNKSIDAIIKGLAGVKKLDKVDHPKQSSVEFVVPDQELAFQIASALRDNKTLQELPGFSVTAWCQVY